MLCQHVGLVSSPATTALRFTERNVKSTSSFHSYKLLSLLFAQVGVGASSQQSKKYTYSNRIKFEFSLFKHQRFDEVGTRTLSSYIY